MEARRPLLLQQDPIGGSLLLLEETIISQSDGLESESDRQVSKTKTLVTCRVRCSKILLVSWSLEKPTDELPPSPPGLESKRLTLSETVAPSLSRALWSTFSLRLDALGRDSFTAWSLPANDRKVNWTDQGDGFVTDKDSICVLFASLTIVCNVVLSTFSDLKTLRGMPSYHKSQGLLK